MKKTLPLYFIFLVSMAIAQDVPKLKFTPDIDFLKMPEGWYLQEVSGVAINSEDHIFVFHRGKHPLLEFDADGDFIRSIAEDLFITPHSIRIDEYDNLWTVDIGSHVVLKFDKNLKLKMIFGKWKLAGTENTRFNIFAHLFNMPTDVAFDSNDNIYITDGYGNSRVMKFDSEGEFIKTWGTPGDSTGQFNTPHTIQVVDDLIYVGDRQNQRIQIFNTEGEPVNIWDNIGYPWALVAYDGGFYMVDGNKSKILSITKDGKINGTYGSRGKGLGQFDWPHAIAVDSKGNLYVSELQNWRVQKLIIEK